MGPGLRRALAATFLILLAAAMGKVAFTGHISSVRDGFYRVQEEDFMLQMPECLQPCVMCPATFDLGKRSVDFAEVSCRFERVFRLMVPIAGRYDIAVTSEARDLYVTRIGGWMLETRECPVAAVDAHTRIVIDRENDRMLIEAPDNAAASITGRVTCPIVRIYSEVLF